MEKIKEVCKVYQTSDYAIFKTLEGNRNVNKLHVKRLKDSFEKTYLLSPILINKNNEIIDGQHRFEAAKELGLPINFIYCVNYGLREVQILNVNMKNWTKHDFLQGFCDLKYPEYLKFRNFMRRFPHFGISISEILLTNKTHDSTSNKELGSYRVRMFEDGELKIPDYEKSVEMAEKIMMIKPYYDGFNRRAFVYAMHGIFKIDHYDHNKFIDRLKTNPNAIQHCVNISQYKLMIEDVYNFRSREKVSLRF